MTTLIYGPDSEKQIEDIRNNKELSILLSEEVKDIINVLIALEFIVNRSEGKRQIEGGSVRIDGKKITQNISVYDLPDTFIITLGKNKKAKVSIPIYTINNDKIIT